MIKEFLSEDPHAPVILLFGGTPEKRQEEITLLASNKDITIFGVLSEEAGYEKISELNYKVNLVLIGGRYTLNQRERIRLWLKDHSPKTIITEPGIDYSYSNESLLKNVRKLLNLSFEE